MFVLFPIHSKTPTAGKAIILLKKQKKKTVKPWLWYRPFRYYFIHMDYNNPIVIVTILKNDRSNHFGFIAMTISMHLCPIK